MTTIYEIINNLIASFFTSEALELYSTYINDVSFILTLIVIFILTLIPFIVIYNIYSTIGYHVKTKETRGSKKKWKN